MIGSIFFALYVIVVEIPLLFLEFMGKHWKALILTILVLAAIRKLGEFLETKKSLK